MGSYLCDWSSNGQKTRKRCRQRLPENFSIGECLESWQDAMTVCVRTDIWKIYKRGICLNELQHRIAEAFESASAPLKTFSRRRRGPRWLSIVFEFHRACRVLCGVFTQLLSSLSITLGLLSPVWTGEGTCGSSPFLSHESFIKGCRGERSETPPEFSLKPGYP